MTHDGRQSGVPTMMFCSLFVAALTACGGGGGGSSGGAIPAATAAAASSADTPVGSAASSADTGAAGAAGSEDAGVVAAASSADTVVVGAASSADTGVVGAASSDDALVLAAAASSTDTGVADVASSTDTGVADVAGTAQTLAAGTGASGTASQAAASSLVVKLAAEGQSFQVLGTMAVQYGAGTSWVTKTVTGSGQCTAAFFGIAAVTGVSKICQVTVATSSATASVPALGLPAAEGGTFYVYGSASVQFGTNGKLLQKTVAGRGECSKAFFGGDPSVGAVKTCAFVPTGATTLARTTLLPAVDATKIPAPAAGYAVARVRAANVADPGQIPTRSDIGTFREYCEFSHMSYADPIAAPGGSSAHLHTFLGNTGANANSTAASLATTGNSTCAGGTLNRTAYWVPSMIDTTDGTPQKPLGSLVYYKQGYNHIASAAIRPFPAGLRIVAGSAASSGPQNNTGFTCFKTDGTWTAGKSIPTDCPAGATLTVGVAFPQCWDGVNLDSPDHKSHMAYPGIGCPSTHPVPVTGITVNINYKVGANGTSRWRLSSDNYDTSLPGGYSTHADWFGGWNADTLTVWTTRCINATMDCHAYLIGDGRILY